MVFVAAAIDLRKILGGAALMLLDRSATVDMVSHAVLSNFEQNS